LEKADRYGDMDELSAVLEKGESGPSVETEKRTGSLGVVAPEASVACVVPLAAVAAEPDWFDDDAPVSADDAEVPKEKAGLLALLDA
jgi:hypothetical protein